MAVDSSLPVGATGESLETVKTGAGYHREGTFLGDPSTDAARARIAKAAPDGSDWGVQAYILGSVTVTNFPATQPVSVAALPLPTGASTEATLAAIKAKTDNLDVLLSTRTKPADVQHVTVDASSVTMDHALTFAGDKVDASGSAVSVSTSALPAGAATDANLSALIGAVAAAPAAYTVAERLYQIGVKLDKEAGVVATEATLQKVLSALKAPTSKSYTTLLHGR